MIKVFVDTSAWVACFNKKDTNHKRAIKVWEELKEQNAILLTTDYILDELFTVLKIRASIDISLKAGNSILASKIIKIVKISEDIFTNAIDSFGKYREHPFSFTDCTSFEIIKKMGMNKVFTFDKDFSIAGFECLP